MPFKWTRIYLFFWEYHLYSNQSYKGWIFSNNLKYRGFSKFKRIKTYDFSTLYTAISHNKLKSKFFQIKDDCFLNRNGTQKCMYKFLVIGKKIHVYFERHHSDSPYKYSEADINGMLGFLVDNIQNSKS
jgi:hypothetical protein